MKPFRAILPAATVAVTSAFVPSALKQHLAAPVFSQHQFSLRLTFDDEQEYDPNDHEHDDNVEASRFLHDGSLNDLIDSVSWLPSTIGCTKGKKSAAKSQKQDKEDDIVSHLITRIRKDSRIMPLFPIGQEVFLPHSEHTINVYEPRYVDLYDFLLDSDKCDNPEFIVTMTNPVKPGVFAQYGVLFRVSDFVEMDDNSSDKSSRRVGAFMERDEDDESGVRYVASHEVKGIVKIHRIINGNDWSNEETFLRAEANVIDDLSESIFVQESEIVDDKKKRKKWSSDDFEASAKEASAGGNSKKRGQTPYEDILDLRDLFSQLVAIQHDLDEDVKFSRDSPTAFARGLSGGSKKFWLALLSWHQYCEQRILSTHVDLQNGFQDKLMDFLGDSDGDLPAMIDLQELPPSLADEVLEVENRLQAGRLELNLSLQKLLEAETQGERVKVFSGIVGEELQKLRTKKALQFVFSEASEASTNELGVARGKDERQQTEEDAERLEDVRSRLERFFAAGSGAGEADRTGTKSQQGMDSGSIQQQHYSSSFLLSDEMGDAFQ